MIRVGDLQLGEAERKAVNEVLDSGRISEGIKTRQFEQEWAKFNGTKHCVAVNSGTSALIATLTAISNLTSQRYVITTPLTFIATVNAIVLTGFTPLFVDIDLDTFGIRPELVNALKSPRIVLPVHLMGYPVDVTKIKKPLIIEDACQAHGSILHGKKVGSFGIAGCFSFYIAHNIQVGEMGAIVTNKTIIYEMLKQIKAHGRECVCSICHRASCPHPDHDPRFTHITLGYNFKTMDFQTAMALTQIGRVKNIITQRQKNVYALNKGLKGIKKLKLPKFDPNVSYFAYPLILKEGNRHNLCKVLEAKGIETRPLYGCIPTQQPAYAYLKATYQGKLPNAEFAGKQGFFIGCHQYITSEQIDYIIKTMREIL